MKKSTSDGIDSKDWDVVHQFALDIVNSDDFESERYTNQLLNFLQSLEKKYGELPSIIATRADYIDDLSERETLYKHAYILSQKQNDYQNCMETAHSLSALYIEEFRDVRKGVEWMEIFKRHLCKSNDGVSEELYKLLHEELEKLKE